eukprot:CAMPEP_0170612442 /NCGR_PEP_ID=MMETSP0224-20130122/23727_1 /TAXON_ID=285029 /ORGANISM="Togula jolla, Strain CCCM 725" /LENGTH=225 /DNA_ID=CAMNT_0010937949 /DNA_START=33 /DNA_END=710 /DNA_ORIENTATION=-
MAASVPSRAAVAVRSAARTAVALPKGGLVGSRSPVRGPTYLVSAFAGRPAPSTAVPALVRACASGASGSGSRAGGAKGTGDKAGEGSKSQAESESDRRYEESGEYDTQERYKRVGNPISWANPTGGGTIDENQSKHWRWVYPAGAGVILLLCLWSRRRNLRKEEEEKMISMPNIQPPDLQRFKTPAYSPPPPESMPSEGDDEDSEAPWTPAGGSFSPPPPASSRW